MPLGTDFICECEGCKAKGCKITMHGAFPIAEIDAVISVLRSRGDEELAAGLESKKSSGRRFAVVPQPDSSGTRVEGVRVQFYVPDESLIVDEDILWADSPDRAASAIEGGDLELPKGLEGKRVISFRRAMDNGLTCPSCGSPMRQWSWFTKQSGPTDWGVPNGDHSSQEG